MRTWRILGNYNPDEPILETLLKLKNIENFGEYLNPPSLLDYVKRFPETFKIAVKTGVVLVKQVIIQQTPIMIFGDYDVDGITSTAILYKTLKHELGYANVSYFIPNRFDHGYGVSRKALVEVLKAVGEKHGGKNMLFIAVDTGVTAVEEIDYLTSLGYMVIIIDHHQKPASLPKTSCLIWSDTVAASVLVWIFSRLLGSQDPQTICLSAMATITDVQNVTGINRAVLKKGLDVINKNPPLGLAELILASGITKNENTINNIGTYELGWVLGPRINAAGRMVAAEDSVQLLIETDKKKIHELAQKLNVVNIERQDKTQQMYDLALSGHDVASLPKIIFSESADYHEGIIGLVAGKIVQKYYRPAVVIALIDGFGKGSVRSIAGVDIISMLRRFEGLFEDLGGHPMAAGFTIKKENIPALKKSLLELADEKIDANLFTPELKIDLEIPITAVTVQLSEELAKMEPFGLGNEEPVFVSRGLGVAETAFVGKDNKHVRFKFYKDGNYLKGIMFGGSESAGEIKYGDTVDVVYTLKKNVYNGTTSVDLVVKELRKTVS
jgi:single-stranded-DNA-specific exonuclease